jgi:hypothetical protein
MIRTSVKKGDKANQAIELVSYEVEEEKPVEVEATEEVVEETPAEETAEENVGE